MVPERRNVVPGADEGGFLKIVRRRLQGYCLGCPHSVGRMLMSLPLELCPLRTRNVAKEASSENPRVPIDGLTSSGALL